MGAEYVRYFYDRQSGKPPRVEQRDRTDLLEENSGHEDFVAVIDDHIAHQGFYNDSDGPSFVVLYMAGPLG